MKNENIVSKDITIVDYHLGNMFSVKHACVKAGLNPIIASAKDDILKAQALILPGVGSFGDAMKNLESLDLINPIKDKIQMGVPLFGICLGLQLLFEESEELGSHKGLGLIKGIVKKFPKEINQQKIKVPNIGWISIYNDKTDEWVDTPLQGMHNNLYMYFVHSYYVIPENSKEVLTRSNYEGLEYCSSIKKDNIYAFQFHPEKSGEEGLKLYKNFKNLIK